MIINEVRERICRAGVVPIVTLSNPGAACAVGQALADGGLDILEVTFRTEGAVEAISALRAGLPKMLIGAGTLTSPEQVDAASSAGAHFALAPGMNPAVLDAAEVIGLPFIPGVSTPTEIEVAMARGLRLLKFFPASVLGGPAGVRVMVQPYRHLGLELLPTGGTAQHDVADYHAVDGVVAVGGSWPAPNELIEKEDWSGITALAHTIVAVNSRA